MPDSPTVMIAALSNNQLDVLGYNNELPRLAATLCLPSGPLRDQTLEGDQLPRLFPLPHAATIAWPFWKGFVLAGPTLSGTYSERGKNNSKHYFNLLDQADSTANYAVGWNSGNSHFEIKNGAGTAIYYSTSAVATPDLASAWKKVSDDSAVTITITAWNQSVRTGLTITAPTLSGNYSQRANYNSKPSYNLLGAYDDPTTASGRWNSGNSHWEITNSSGAAIYYSASAVATPDLATGWKKVSDDSSVTVTFVAWTDAFTLGLPSVWWQPMIGTYTDTNRIAELNSAKDIITAEIARLQRIIDA